MKRIAVKFESNEEVGKFINAIMSEEEWKMVVDLFPTDKEVGCVAKKEKYNEDLMPTIAVCLSTLGLPFNYYEY